MYYQRAVTIGVPCNTFQLPACKTIRNETSCTQERSTSCESHED